MGSVSISHMDEENNNFKPFFIDANEKHELCFKESLILVDENKNKKGDIIIRVEEITDRALGFLVHISSNQCIDNQLHEMSVTSKISNNLQTIEEIRTETTNNGQKKKRLYISGLSDKYEITVSMKLLNDIHEKRKYLEIPNTSSPYLISEGANIILLRKIALSGYVGTFLAKSILINGTVCSAQYTAEPDSISEELLYPQPIKLIKRNVTIDGILYPVNLEHLTVLTKRGQIFRHSWSDSLLTIQTDPQNVIQDTNTLSVGSIPLKKCWRDDMELCCIFRDKVFESLMINQLYLNDNPQTYNLIQDFLQQVLLKKPEDPVHFAIKFFTK